MRKTRACINLVSRLATAISVMDDVDEIDDTHPESNDAFAAYVADGGMENRDREPVYCPGLVLRLIQGFRYGLNA